MSFIDKNDVLQRATSDGTWIFWRDDCAYLANSSSHVLLGGADEGIDALIARIPDAERRLSWMKTRCHVMCLDCDWHGIDAESEGNGDCCPVCGSYQIEPLD